MSATPHGAITGWVVGSADINHPLLMEAFLSARCGHPQVVQPPRNPDWRVVWRLPRTRDLSVVGVPAVPQLSDLTWQSVISGEPLAQAVVRLVHHRCDHHPSLSQPTSLFAAWKRWLRQHSQSIETAFTFLDMAFDLKHLSAHSLRGQFTRLAAKSAVYNLSLFINRFIDRTLGALVTLIC